MNLEPLYAKLPVPLHNWAIGLRARHLQKRRYGRGFQALFEEVIMRGKIEEDELHTYQQHSLSQLLQNAAKTPFWSERFARYDVRVNSDDGLAEINKLPILSKEEVKDNAERIRNPKIPYRSLIKCHTSGSTGSGLIFWETYIAERERWATWWRYRQWHGLHLDSWSGYFGGRSIVPANKTKPPFWRMNRPMKQLAFSAFHLSEMTAASYLDALREHGIPWLHGYPSVISLLASHMLDQGLKPWPQLELITTGAENLQSQQRNLMEQAFRVPIFEHYGQVESVANVSQCEAGSLHVDEDFSLVEFIPLEDKDAPCRIIGTNLTNPAFPLIRYDTGDLATLSEVACPCQRPGRVVTSIDGRNEDYITLSDGVRLGRLDHIFKDLIHIREAQIYQADLDHIIIYVVKGNGYDEHHEEARLIQESRLRLCNRINIDIQYVSEIPRTQSGKIRFVISDVSQT